MNEHYINLDSMIQLDNINNILDAGSGRTSLGYLIYKFPNANIDAIIFPGDNRKIDSIRENVKGIYNLKEIDLCNTSINESYDLVLAHLLLGEATKFGNKFEDLLNRLLNINSKYFLIYDLKEDIGVNYNYIEQVLKEKGFQIIKHMTFKKEEEQSFGDFIGRNYIAYLVKK
ncbi:MAG TPA: hypothetical protein PKY25_01535 [Bacilli bacterium]|nr:hypothetical protein [Bacilli bacterium]